MQTRYLTPEEYAELKFFDDLNRALSSNDKPFDYIIFGETFGKRNYQFSNPFQANGDTRELVTFSQDYSYRDYKKNVEVVVPNYVAASFSPNANKGAARNKDRNDFILNQMVKIKGWHTIA